MEEGNGDSEILDTTVSVNEEESREALVAKCTRLETQVKQLRELSNLRKDLIEIRERESLDLLEKLKNLEALVETEKIYGQELATRITAAEAEVGVLTERLEQNGFSLEEMKLEYNVKIQDLTRQLEKSEKECEKLVERNEALVAKIEADKSEEFKKVERQLHIAMEKNRVLNFQMSLLNTLFNENENPLDLDKVRAIGDLVRETQPEALKDSESEDTPCRKASLLDFDGIIQKLDASELSVQEIPGQESCYQNAEGSDGSTRVLSVSRTFIKIKDLILEKKSLKKEIDGLKTLNDKLFKKVDRHEKRLSNVTIELNKTWSLVTTLEQQQKALHNSRSALRYDLKEKRKILNKIKRDLATSRDKSMKAKLKNSASQLEWNSIREEFARRRAESTSLESGAFSGSNDDSNEIEIETEIETETETEEETEKRKALEDEFDDEFVEELEDEIEGIEAAADEESEDEEEEPVSAGNTNWDVLVNRRALRLKLLEEQCRLLYDKLKASSARNTDLVTKLSNLHDHYGSEQEQDGTVRDSEIPSSSSSLTPPRTNPGNELLETFHTVQGTAVAVQLVNESSSSSAAPGDAHGSTQNSLATNKDTIHLPNSQIPIPPPLPPWKYNLEERSGSASGSARSSPDLNVLGRLIIQQLPKRLELLRQENSDLIKEAIATKDNMRETQIELDSQKRMSMVLQDQIKDHDENESKLREELEIKRKLVEELEGEVGKTAGIIEGLEREKEKMEKSLELFIQERASQSRRQSVKSMKFKHCATCNVKFTLLKRKVHCKGCGSGVCTTCSNSAVATSSRSQQLRFCIICSERKQKLDALAGDMNTTRHVET